MEKFLNNIFWKAIESYLTDEGLPNDAITPLFKNNDISSTRFADFQHNGIVRIFRGFVKLKKDLIKEHTVSITMCNFALEVINRVSQMVSPFNMVQSITHGGNFINITLNNSFILNTVINYGNHLIKNGPKHYDMFGSLDLNLEPTISKQKIIVDYSSPNVAKSLHIGHLRSTVIGETIVRLLLNEGHEVIGLNHIGDWGTQFGMIINFLKTIYSSDVELIKFVESADSHMLMEIYRSAKKAFDLTTNKQNKDIIICDLVIDDQNKDLTTNDHNKEKKSFADESREQTYLLQQGDPFNIKIWKKICAISSREYSNIYKLLNIQHLTERGESFYQPIIPYVLKMLENEGLLKKENGATIIQFNNWEYPLMIVKSDGGYTYDTTDLAALYHRLCIEKADSVIYITDSGQKTHFDMCFDVAHKMGWVNYDSESKELKKLTHIGFGLVLGKDGTKLKTRSGDVIKMLDVIDEVVQLSNNIICDRVNKCKTISTDGSLETDPTSIYYQNISNTEIVTMSQRIGLNTLKYFDLSHRFETNYKYDPELMFRFTGDTGVYLMYCFARINGIIEKSPIVSDLNLKRNVVDTIQPLFNKLELYMNDNIIDNSYFTKPTRELMIHIINFGTNLDRATKNLNSVELTKYLYALCTYFNTFVGQKNGKIIGSQNETIGIVLCLIVSKIIEHVFNLLSFEPVNHI
jgi:arginyl-tRNA synthetase